MIIYVENIGKTPKKIYITEEQLSLIKEGVELSPRDSKTINFSINQDKSDKANTYADTRFFGKRREIAYGDGTNRRGIYQGSFNKKYENKLAIERLYKAAIDIINNDRYDEIDSIIEPIECVGKTKKTVKDILKDTTMSAEEKINRINGSITRNRNYINTLKGKYDRINADGVNDDDTLPRYNVGLVPNTNVRFIGLFEIGNFNFSDAIKHGNMRPSDNIEKMVGELPFVDKLGRGPTKEKVKVSYDDSDITPDVASNFSLKGIETNPFDIYRNNGHYKQQYGYNDKNYTTVAQFMDKSIMGAAYAIRKEKVEVDYILDAPSSSKFNHYYCTNLSNKLGVEYRMNFFQRNMLNVHIDEEMARKSGINEGKLQEAKMVIKNAVIGEIVSYMNEKIEVFIDENIELLSVIPYVKSSQEKVGRPLLVDIVRELSYDALTNSLRNNPELDGKYLVKYIINHFGDFNIKAKSTKFDIGFITERFKSIVEIRLKKSYSRLLTGLSEILFKYSEQLMTEGVKLAGKNKFKVTKLDSNIRPFIKNAYVIADSEMARNKGGILDKLRATLQNKHFLIVDEDMDSGATLQLLISALKDKQLECGDNTTRFISDEQITCLVNGINVI